MSSAGNTTVKILLSAALICLANVAAYAGSEYTPTVALEKIDAATASADLKSKAQAFVRSAKMLGSASGTSLLERKRVTDALTKLMNGDTSGVMTALYREDPYMGALVSYLGEKVENREYRDISSLMARLRNGNDLKQNVIEFLSIKVNEVYVNQLNLGHFMGSLVAAIKNEASVEAERANIAEKIAATFEDRATAESGLTIDIVREIENKITKDYAQWKGGLFERFLAVGRG